MSNINLLTLKKKKKASHPNIKKQFDKDVKKQFDQY